MNLKKLFIFFILFLLHSINLYLVASEVGIQQAKVNKFLIIPKELLPTISSFFDCKTMRIWKLTCTSFNVNADYEYIVSDIIRLENYDTCTTGLIYFSDIDKKNNFKKLIKNKFDKRIADLKILGWGSNPSFEEQMSAYKGVQGSLLTGLNYGIFNLKRLRRLIHINPNMRMIHKGDTPLLWALHSQNFEIVKLLLNHKKINPNLADRCGITPLYWACVNNWIECITLLLYNNKTDPNIPNKVIGRDVFAAMVQALLDRKRPLPDREDDGTALCKMCYSGQPEIVKLLLNNEKTDPNLQDADGNTILHKMCSKNYFEIVQLLLNNKKINVKIKNKEGKTALDGARENGDVKIAELLIAKGARYDWSARIRHMLSITLVIISMYALEWIINNHSIEEITMLF